MNENIVTYILPASWASALVNGDWDGLNENDAAVVRRWLVDNEPGVCLDCSDDQYFANKHDAWQQYPFKSLCLTYSFSK